MTRPLRASLAVTWICSWTLLARGQGLDSDACEVGTGCDETGLMQRTGSRQQLQQGQPEKCDTSEMEKTKSPLLTASKNSSSVCNFAAQNKNCVQKHYDAFRESASYLAGHSPSSGFLDVAFNELYMLANDKQSASTLETGVTKSASQSELDPLRCMKAHFPWSKPTWYESMTKQGVKFKTTALHDRHDYQCPNCPEKHYLAAIWQREVMMQRYLIQQGETLPENVVLNTTAEYISNVTSVLDASISVFNLTNCKQLKAVQDRVAVINWDQIIIHTYAALPNVLGNIYSPAFNSVWVAWDNITHELSHYMIIAADAEGNAAQKYIGADFETLYESITGFDYTPLTGSVENPLYFDMPKFDPTDLGKPFAFNIDVWHVATPPPERSYIKVTSEFSCTMMDLNFAPAIVNVIAKEYYMNKIIIAWCGTDLVDWHDQGVDFMPAPECESMKGLQDALFKVVAPQDHIEACKGKEATSFFSEATLFKLLRSIMTPYLNVFGWTQRPRCLNDNHPMLSTDVN